MFMVSILGWFRDGGIFMFLILAVILAVGPIVMVTAMTSVFVDVRAAKGISGAALLFAAIPAVCGAIGTWRERAIVTEAITLVTPDQAEVLREFAYPAALHPLEFGGSASLVLAAVATMALTSAIHRSRPGSAPHDP
ncbi:MAG: hypothetical protein H6738_24130 [Alphaproteobacteria bacterium]|nr:hypothetical protein [Alphaproteobacteria bacterium]MCB9699898.1 hypothetical protein [Alphaproteobacteria bacterium]